MQFMATQTDERIDGDIDRDGYCILRDVFSEEYLEPKRELVHEIIEFRENGNADPLTGPDSEYMDHRVDQGVLYDVFFRYPELQDMPRNERILDAVEYFLGPNIYLYVTSLVYKPPEGRNEVPMHQDFLGRPGESDRYIAWMPLYDATRENGCLKAIPGSHKDGFRDYYTVEGETHHKRLEEDEYSESDVEYFEMDAGDVLIFHHQLIHGSDEVTVDDPRHAYRAVFKSPSADDIALPRGSQVILRGGDPKSLKQAGKDVPIEELEEEDDRSIVRRGLHYLGSRLQNI